MEDSNDILLRQFFSEAASRQLADDGFTERVMGRLPSRINWFVRLWTAFCMAVGVVLFVAFRGWALLADHLLMLLHSLLHAHVHFSVSSMVVVLFGLLFVAVCEVFIAERRLA